MDKMYNCVKYHFNIYTQYYFSIFEILENNVSLYIIYGIYMHICHCSFIRKTAYIHDIKRCLNIKLVFWFCFTKKILVICQYCGIIKMIE